MKQLSGLVELAGVGLLTVPCVALINWSAPAAAPVIVTNNLPSADEGGAM